MCCLKVGKIRLIYTILNTVDLVRDKAMDVNTRPILYIARQKNSKADEYIVARMIQSGI